MAEHHAPDRARADARRVASRRPLPRADRVGRRVAAGGVVAAVAAGLAAATGVLPLDRLVPPSAALPVPGTPPLAGVAPSPGAEGADGADGSTDGEATGLDPELERRVAAAQAAAAADGVTLTVTSGWRSAAEQQALVDDAVRRYGSIEEARRWVLPPESSAHVQGLAVDVGPTEGVLWLGEHGLEHGLCRTYANESWHFEKLPDGADRCPDLLPDSSGGW